MQIRVDMIQLFWLIRGYEPGRFERVHRRACRFFSLKENLNGKPICDDGVGREGRYFCPFPTRVQELYGSARLATSHEVF